jgi:adenylate cyclase class IV
MSTADLQFTEIEHKFVVDEHFSVPRFREALAALNPVRTSSVRVRDRYFLTEGGRDRHYVIRHRFDEELHHLTVKSLGADTEVRVEVNLDLGHHAGDQAAQVDAFLDQLGVAWRGTLHKDVDVWHFPDCEIVYYEASSDCQSVRCVEFEALQKASLADARVTLEAYERATGFDGAVRSSRSLLEILFPEVGPR